ncbi:glutathione S-transferase [Vogesella oryzae]|uniref:glutathione S-transferase n=1 Tax=Vogesella oryzae TaxID=1735285 RepID=UPI001582D7D4|nr:glutathione S-transferase [Vogesella oryzae]
MKLIASLTSPYARKVRIVLAEKKIDCPLQVDIPWETTSTVADFNPLGKVPVLIMDDGSTLYDSRVIVEYLENSSPVSRLLPQDSKRMLIETRRWEALADGICDAAACIVVEKRRPADKQSQEWIDRQQGKVDRGLQALSSMLGERQWCNGEAYSLADIATGCALGFLDFRFPQLDWRSPYPNLAALEERLAARPTFAETVPPAA